MHYCHCYSQKGSKGFWLFCTPIGKTGRVLKNPLLILYDIVLYRSHVLSIETCFQGVSQFLIWQWFESSRRLRYWRTDIIFAFTTCKISLGWLLAGRFWHFCSVHRASWQTALLLRASHPWSADSLGYCCPSSTLLRELPPDSKHFEMPSLYFHFMLILKLSWGNFWLEIWMGQVCCCTDWQSPLWAQVFYPSPQRHQENLVQRVPQHVVVGVEVCPTIGGLSHHMVHVCKERVDLFPGRQLLWKIIDSFRWIEVALQRGQRPFPAFGASRDEEANVWGAVLGVRLQRHGEGPEDPRDLWCVWDHGEIGHDHLRLMCPAAPWLVVGGREQVVLSHESPRHCCHPLQGQDIQSNRCGKCRQCQWSGERWRHSQGWWPYMSAGCRGIESVHSFGWLYHVLCDSCQQPRRFQAQKVGQHCVRRGFVHFLSCFVVPSHKL